MDLTVRSYIVYLVLSLGLTVWVARTLFRSGRRFLVDVFAGDEGLADAVNHLLVVGFYLVNMGFVSFALRYRGSLGSTREAIEMLSAKMGAVLLVLGFLHFGNLCVFSKLRRTTTDRPRPPGRRPDKPVIGVTPKPAA